MPCFPGGIAAGDGHIGKIDRCIASTSASQCTHGSARAVTPGLGAEILLLSQADKQHALGGHAGESVQQSRRAGLALHVAEAQQVAQFAARGAITRRSA